MTTSRFYTCYCQECGYRATLPQPWDYCPRCGHPAKEVYPAKYLHQEQRVTKRAGRERPASAKA